ncbi:divisome-associated lipoprotein YraP [Corallincola luteus]|uniref:Osmotically-inducible protein OsmY n=4 Tax=Psychromonadaceae TaxID=267894 RepID=A0A368NIZ6_9GAMM|nr:osmotically-inducible protein OsmY [Corallincola holothuriorum]TAA45231.1 divisome-associated lipoprotein YraP [Corallincola spongiicola]TCI03784.1 divisome-associated lipoprotein YraP [Corallincola luteus]
MPHRRLLGVVLAGTLALQGCAAVIIAGAAGTAAAIDDRRTLGSQIDDNAIEIKAVGRLRERKDIWDHSRISISSVNGTLLLVGQAPTAHLRNEISRVVEGIPSVKTVHNEVKVGTPISLTTQSNDAWITTKVKADLIGDKEVNGNQVKVVTENSEVYLLGLLTKQEASKATEIARNVTGVKQVVRVFEYTSK